MKKTILFLFAAVFAGTSAFGQQGRISGEIEGWGNDTLTFDYMAGGRFVLDTVYARNGKFEHTFPVEGFTQVIVSRGFDNDSYYIPSTPMLHAMIDTGEQLTIRGKVRPDGALEYTAEGSSLMEDFSRFRAQTLPLMWRIDSAEFAMVDAEQRNAPDEEKLRIMKRARELIEETKQASLAFVRAHPDRMMAGLAAIGVPEDDFAASYALLSDEVKSGPLKPMLDLYKAHMEELQARKGRFTGQPAPDFTLTDIHGMPFSLSGYDPKGKYTILDFWGSWCPPCIGGMPEMKEYYDKYRDKLEIIGIACRDKEAAWKKAVADNALPWIQVIDDGSAAGNDAAARYKVKAYPTKIVLAPDKTVAFVFEGEGGDFYRKLDELLSKP